MVKANSPEGKAQASKIRAAFTRAQSTGKFSGISRTTSSGTTFLSKDRKVIESTTAPSNSSPGAGAVSAVPAPGVKSGSTLGNVHTPPPKSRFGLLPSAQAAAFSEGQEAAAISQSSKPFLPKPSLRTGILAVSGLSPTLGSTLSTAFGFKRTRQDRIDTVKILGVQTAGLSVVAGATGLVGKAATLGPAIGSKISTSSITAGAKTGGSAAVRVGKQIAIGATEFEVATTGAKVITKATAPKEQREFLPITTSDIPFVGIFKPSETQLIQRRAQSEAFPTKGLFNKSIAALPGGIFARKQTREKLETSFKTQFEEKGLTGDRLDTAVKAQQRLSIGAGVGEAVGLLAISTRSELFGQKELGRKFGAGIKFAKPGFKTVGVAAFNPIARAGAVEGAVSVFGFQRAREQKVSPKSIAIGAGVGAVSAGTFGSVIAGGKSSLTTKGKFIGRTTELGGYIIDPFEKPGDLLAGAITGVKSRVTGVPVLTAAIVPTKTGSFTTTTSREKVTSLIPFTKVPVRTSTPIPTFTQSQTKTQTKVNTRVPTTTKTNTFVPTTTKSHVPTTTKTNTFVPTTTKSHVPTFTNTFVTTPTTTSVPVPTTVPTAVPAFTPTTVPTSVIFPRFPAGVIPFGVGLAGRTAKTSGFGKLFGAFTPNLRGIVSGKIEKGKPKRFYSGVEVRGLRKGTANILKGLF